MRKTTEAGLKAKVALEAFKGEREFLTIRMNFSLDRCTLNGCPC